MLIFSMLLGVGGKGYLWNASGASMAKHQKLSGCFAVIAF